MDQDLQVPSLRKADYINWKADPVTQAIFQALYERVKELHLELGNGQCLGNEALYAQYVGYIQGLKALFNIEYIDEEEQNNNA